MSNTSVLQSWVQQIPWKQQSILISGLRGPDSGNYPMVRRVIRWMRRVAQHNADPSKDYMKLAAQPAFTDVTDELEYLQCHFVHHFADALRVIGINHPEQDERVYANALHVYIAEEIFHFVTEPPDVFVQRHRDQAALAAALAPKPEQDEYASEAEYQHHVPWCKARHLGRLVREHCNCDAPAAALAPHPAPDERK